MKPKLIFCLALVLSGICSAFAFASFVQLEPGTIASYSNILIRSKLDAGGGNYRNYYVVLLPRENFQPADWEGCLEIRDGTNRLASCAVNGVMLSDVSPKGYDFGYAAGIYRVMTNRFSRPLNGAKVFTFQVATNLLGSSSFSMSERDYDEYIGFSLKDFSDGK